MKTVCVLVAVLVLGSAACADQSVYSNTDPQYVTYDVHSPFVDIPTWSEQTYADLQKMAQSPWVIGAYVLYTVFNSVKTGTWPIYSFDIAW